MDKSLGPKARWVDVVDSIVSNRSRISKVIFFLHLPKTGGTTVSAHMTGISDWATIRMDASYLDSDICECGVRNCTEHRATYEFPSNAEGAVPCNWFCHFSHESYDSLVFLRDEVRRSGGPTCDIYITHRPARVRLASMFKDYWRMALEAGPADGVDPRHEERVRKGYRAASLAYIDRSGRIDGRSWFQAFASSGSGVAFSMTEVFGGSPMRFRLALADGDVRVVPTGKLDDWLRNLTKTDRIERRRVSASPPENVIVALNEARDIVERLAERDWAFDQAVDEYELVSNSGRRFRA